MALSPHRREGWGRGQFALFEALSSSFGEGAGGVAERAAGLAVARGYDLGHDRQGDLLGRLRADVEPDGRVDVRELLLGDPLSHEPLAALDVRLLAADGADVAHVRVHDALQNRLVVL